jgi:hypothetical protein
MHPAAFLSSLQNNERKATRCVVFTDQLVTASDAPLLIKHGDTKAYYPTLELIAHQMYGFTIHAWTGETRRTSLPPHSCHTEVLHILQAYFEACRSLGSRWLVRDIQHHKSTEHRIAEARRRARGFQSALMFAHRASALPSDCRDLIRTLTAIERIKA